MIICYTFLIIILSFQVRKKSQDTAEQLNLNNLEKFKTANRQRSDILDLVTIIISINNINHNYHHMNQSITMITLARWAPEWTATCWSSPEPRQGWSKQERPFTGICIFHFLYWYLFGEAIHRYLDFHRYLYFSMTVLVIINRTKDSDCQAECYISGIL